MKSNVENSFCGVVPTRPAGKSLSAAPVSVCKFSVSVRIAAVIAWFLVPAEGHQQPEHWCVFLWFLSFTSGQFHQVPASRKSLLRRAESAKVCALSAFPANLLHFKLLRCCSFFRMNPSFFRPLLRRFVAISGSQWKLLGLPHRPVCYMAKGKKAKNQAATTAKSGKVAAAAAAAAATAATATAAADGNNLAAENTKANTNFQAFISDLEASPSFNQFSHANAGHGSNTTDRQEDELPSGKGKETEATDMAKPSFASLFSTNRRLTMDNKLSKFQIDEGTITLESDDLTDVRSKLGFCIVGYVAGKFPGLQAIRTLSKSWELLFNDTTVAGLCSDLQGMKTGTASLPEEDDISLTPVWAILPSLPLECWHPNALGKIGSRLGTPIAMDSLTMRMERVSYARILVEVDASKTLVDHVEFKLPNGVIRKQPIVYEYTPKFCTKCNRFGHHQNSCHDSQQPEYGTATATGRQKTETKQTHTAATELKQKQSNATTELKLKQSVTVTERKQKTVTEMADVPAHEGPESPKQHMSLKEQRHSSPLRQKEAEIDSSASSCEPDSSGSTQHLMPGTTSYHGLKLQLGGETPPQSP
ncbi:UNVERIFIED_CONTAM: hypothetical protein Sangu_2168300 [Sesamum angustifolium]|uniref:DUF4283 domain-containing protein n=1 Tax=Sesamum angustifolium TaxID=2727405 RepID=A0AAW2LEJ8_9LAMI